MLVEDWNWGPEKAHLDSVDSKTILSHKYSQLKQELVQI